MFKNANITVRIACFGVAALTLTVTLGLWNDAEARKDSLIFEQSRAFQVLGFATRLGLHSGDIPSVCDSSGRYHARSIADALAFVNNNNQKFRCFDVPQMSPAPYVLPEGQYEIIPGADGEMLVCKNQRIVKRRPEFRLKTDGSVDQRNVSKLP